MGLVVYFKKKFTRKSPASTRLSSRTSGIEADDVLFGAKSQVLLQESGKTILAGWPSRANWGAHHTVWKGRRLCVLRLNRKHKSHKMLQECTDRFWKRIPSPFAAGTSTSAFSKIWIFLWSLFLSNAVDLGKATEWRLALELFQDKSEALKNLSQAWSQALCLFGFRRWNRDLFHKQKAGHKGFSSFWGKWESHGEPWRAMVSHAANWGQKLTLFACERGSAWLHPGFKSHG